jgi:transcription elongation factor Elf1
LGRRRRRVIKVVKKKLPSVFTCPQCGEEAIRVKLPQGAGPAIVQCGSCGLKREFEATPSSQIVDIYCMFTDTFYARDKPAVEESKREAEQPASAP